MHYIDSANNKNAKLQRWAVKISAFGGKIEYIKGKNNVVADFLSRMEQTDNVLGEITQSPQEATEEHSDTDNPSPVVLSETLNI